ncbi:MAG: HAD family hydrolase [Sulfuriferula sp.]
MSKAVVAAFDFDGTLTRGDSFLSFLRTIAGRRRFLLQMLGLSPSLLAYVLGAMSNHRVKNRLLAQFLRGKEVSSVEQVAQNFATGQLPGFIKPSALARLRWHQQEGHRCIIVSASLECYLRPWAATVGVAEVIGSQLAVDGEVYTGALTGLNCYGAEKTRRLTALLGEREAYTLYAYGDSKGDRELLALADYAYYRQMPEAGRHDPGNGS